MPVYYAGLLQPWDFSDTEVELGLSVVQSDDVRPMNWEGMTYVLAIPKFYSGAPGGAGAAANAGGAAFSPASAIPWINGQPPSDAQISNLFPSFDYLVTRISDEPGVLQLRPASVDAATWNVILSNLKMQVGDTLGDWVTALDNNASYLGRQGISVNDIGDLWSFEVLQAMGLGPQRVLDSAVDAAMVTPGVDLSLSRSFVNTISGRYRSGPFGQGWALNWDSHLTEGTDGAVTIAYGGDSTARYEPDSRTAGKYFSQPGDTSVLTKLLSGEFDLRSADGTVTHYLSTGTLQYVRDPNGNQVTAGYTAGRLTSLTHSSGQSISIFYNAAGHIDHVTDSAGRVTSYGYDPTDQYLLTVTEDDGKQIHYTYQTTGPAPKLNALLSIEVGGATQFFTYDAEGRLDTSYVSGNTQLVHYGYDDAGEVTVNDGLGTTTLYFDNRGILVKTRDALGNLTSAQFDDNARLVKLIAPTGEIQDFTWNLQGGLTSFTDELGQTTTFAYNNPFNQLTSFTDAKGNVTGYNYDATGNLLTTVYPNNSVDTYGNYTATGLPQSYTNRRNQTATYEYYASGQIKKQTLSDGSHNDFTYDTRGNLLTVTEFPAAGPSKLTTYSYEYATDGDRLKKVTYSNGRFLAFGYDNFGRRQSTTDQDGYTTTYEYDQAGRLHILRDAANAILVTYTYDGTGRLSRIDKGNGTYTTYEYDFAGQILHLVNHGDATTINSRFDYTYDSRGRRKTMATLDGTWTYTYDATSQLTRAVFASLNTAASPTRICSISMTPQGTARRRSSTVSRPTTSPTT